MLKIIQPLMKTRKNIFPFRCWTVEKRRRRDIASFVKCHENLRGAMSLAEKNEFWGVMKGNKLWNTCYCTRVESGFDTKPWEQERERKRNDTWHHWHIQWIKFSCFYILFFVFHAQNKIIIPFHIVHKHNFSSYSRYSEMNVWNE